MIHKRIFFHFTQERLWCDSDVVLLMEIVTSTDLGIIKKDTTACCIQNDEIVKVDRKKMQKLTISVHVL